MRKACGWVVFALLVQNLWMVIAPVVAGPLPLYTAQVTCPSPRIVHGVGGNLKTFIKEVDDCTYRRTYASALRQ